MNTALSLGSFASAADSDGRLPERDGAGGTTMVDLSPDGLPFLPALGEARYASIGNETHLHVHPGLLEILLCRRGRGIKLDYGGRTLPFPPGTVMVARPDVPHTLTATPGYPDIAVETGVPQVLSTMAWTANGSSKCYVMRGPVTGNASTSGSYTGAARISVGGNMLSWTPNFVGDIAEIRIYNRPLTGRERSEVQFELCSRYGVSWTGHGGIDDTALAWCANGAQFGYWEGDGLPEAVVTTATAGGATLALDQAPAASAYSRGYLAHNGGDGLERVWYVTAATAAKNLPMTLSFDANVVGTGTFALDRSDSPDGRWSRVGSFLATANGQYAYSFEAGEWQGGFYRLRKQNPFVMQVR